MPTKSKKTVTPNKSKKPLKKEKQDKKPGRPKIEIDWDAVARMTARGDTQEDICLILGICRATLNNHKAEAKEFLDKYKEGQAGWRSKLRKWQRKLAESGHPGMLIWLGKQYCKQSDKTDVKTTGETVKTIKLERVDKAPK